MTQTLAQLLRMERYCLCCVVLWCVVLFLIALCCIVLYCIALYCNICFLFYCVVLYCIVSQCIVMYCVFFCCVVLCCVVLRCVVFCCVFVMCLLCCLFSITILSLLSIFIIYCSSLDSLALTPNQMAPFRSRASLTFHDNRACTCRNGVTSTKMASLSRNIIRCARDFSHLAIQTRA